MLILYKYSGYGIGFDSKGRFLFPDGSFAQNVIIFRADMSSFVNANGKKKDILILGERSTHLLQRINIQSILLKEIQNFV